MSNDELITKIVDFIMGDGEPLTKQEFFTIASRLAKMDRLYGEEQDIRGSGEN